MFFKKKKETADASAYTKAEYEAAVKKSICTGEMTFGFIRKADGHFVDIALVRNEEEMARVGISGAARSLKAGILSALKFLIAYDITTLAVIQFFNRIEIGIKKCEVVVFNPVYITSYILKLSAFSQLVLYVD